MITREGDIAIIEHADPAVSVTRLKIGPQIDSMSDAAILDLFNLTIKSQEELAAEYDNTVTEIPPGRPQIKYIESSHQWMPGLAASARRQPQPAERRSRCRPFGIASAGTRGRSGDCALLIEAEFR